MQALPNWSVLTLAGHPVALTVENCAQVPEIRASSSAKVGRAGAAGPGACEEGCVAGKGLGVAAPEPLSTHPYPLRTSRRRCRRRTS